MNKRQVSSSAASRLELQSYLRYVAHIGLKYTLKQKNQACHNMVKYEIRLKISANIGVP